MIRPVRSMCAARTALRIPWESRRDTIRLPAETSEEALIARDRRLNADPAVDGILVQLPLPATVQPRAVMEAVDPGQGRRRLPSTECRAPGGGSPWSGALHAAGRDAAAGPRPTLAGRRARPGARSLDDCRPADGGAAAARPCHRHRGPYPHARSRRRVPARRRDRGGGQAGRNWCVATGLRRAPR